MSIQKITLTGTAREAGRIYGESLRENIQAVYGIYREWWRICAIDMPNRVAGFRRAVENYFGDLALEIEGIAQGSGLSPMAIYALNARTELLGCASMLECTSLGIGKDQSSTGEMYLAQNWDWLSELRGNTALLHYQLEGKPEVLTLVEAGQIGKIGLNSYGLGLMVNYLDTARVNPAGIPVHILMRGILETQSCEDAMRLLTIMPRAASCNYLVGDGHGTLVCMETTPQRLERVPYSGFVAHTNSYLGQHCARQEKVSSLLSRVLSSQEKISERDLVDALGAKGVVFPRGQIETIHTVLLNLNRKEMSVSEGIQGKEFVKFEL